MSNHFDRSSLPPARSFYESEGFKLSRPNSKGWAMAKGQPPCHKSESGRSFSINVNHGGFVCFGCGARGDMVKYVQIRDRCGFVDACKSLDCWRGNATAEERTAIVRRAQEREWHRHREAEKKETERRERLQIRDELHTTVRIYYDLDSLLHELGPVPEAEPVWGALPPTLDCWRLEESEYCRAAKLKDPYCE
jgi:CHC2-type zinc finger protein